MSEKDEEKKKAERMLEEKSLQLALLDQELRKIEEQYKLIDQTIMNIELTKLNLEGIKKLKKTEILASLAEGIYVKANIDSVDKVLVNVGKGVVVEKTIEETKEILDKKIDELSMLKTILSSEAEKILNEIKIIEEEVNKLVKT